MRARELTDCSPVTARRGRSLARELTESYGNGCRLGIKGIRDSAHQIHPLPRFLGMTSTQRFAAFRRYSASREAQEIASDESLFLKSAMAKDWKTVLIRRAVKKLAVAKAARGRSIRVAHARRGSATCSLLACAFRSVSWNLVIRP